MKSNKKTRIFSFVLVLAMLMSLIPSTIFANSTTAKIDIVSFNDFHGSLLTSGEKDKNMGAVKFVQAIKEKKLANPNTLVVSAGDNFNGSAMSNLTYGEPTALMMNHLNIVASAIGNHEYDWGTDKFTAWSKIMGAPFIGANVCSEETGETVEYAKPYIIKNVDGIRVAFLGLTTVETAYKTKPENVKGIEFKNPLETAKKYVPEIKEKGADIVILLTHLSTFQNENTKSVTFEDGTAGLASIKDVDGIITGHSHQSVAGKLNGVPVVQGYYNGRSVGVISLEVDKTTKKIVSSTAEVDELYKRKADIPDDTKMKMVLDVYLKKINPILTEVVAVSETPLSHDKNTLSVLGQWTAEVMQKKADAQISVTNGGGLRRSLEQGNITMGDLYEVMPFDNVLSTFEMTGKQVKEVFEHGIENKEIGWIQYSGVIIEYVPGAEKGSKISKITLENGEEIADDKVYKVVTNDFMAQGGDEFTTFLNAKFISESLAIREAMAEELKSLQRVNYNPIERAIPVSSLEMAS